MSNLSENLYGTILNLMQKASDAAEKGNLQYLRDTLATIDDLKDLDEYLNDIMAKYELEENANEDEYIYEEIIEEENDDDADFYFEYEDEDEDEGDDDDDDSYEEINGFVAVLEKVEDSASELKEDLLRNLKKIEELLKTTKDEDTLQDLMKKQAKINNFIKKTQLNNL